MVAVVFGLVKNSKQHMIPYQQEKEKNNNSKMPLKLSNIIQGANKKLFKKRTNKNYPSITWLQEKSLKHQDETNIKSIRLGNLTFHYKFPFEILHTYRELFEDEIYRFTADTSTPLIIDCGANIGLSVVYFKSLYPQSTIIAYEPDEANIELLNKNIEANKYKNVTIKKEAVWIQNEKLYFKSIGSQGSQIAADGLQKHDTVEVNAIRLAEVLQSHPIDFLKIDIEGAEYEVMKDCAQSLGKVKNIFVEYHGKVSETEKLTAILNILQNNGFRVYIKMAADQLNHPFVLKQTGGSFDVQLNIFGYRQHL